MAKRSQQHQLSAEIAEVASSAAPPAPAAPAAPPEVTPDQIAQLILKSTDNTKAVIRKALDLDKTHTRQRKSTMTNSQVRNTVKAVGEVTHADGFIPDPPARIAERGPEAIEIWKQRWLDNNGDNLSEYDLDHMSVEAHM